MSGFNIYHFTEDKMYQFIQQLNAVEENRCRGERSLGRKTFPVTLFYFLRVTEYLKQNYCVSVLHHFNTVLAEQDGKKDSLQQQPIKN